ncbi:MAG: hypothetical protein HYY09_01835, partial [Firmicutes bacterium]|nr:hypothetical protein [Bacillota bacterium]
MAIDEKGPEKQVEEKQTKNLVTLPGGREVVYPDWPKIGPPPLEDTPHRKPVMLPVPPDKLIGNLEKYCRLAVERGADEAVIFPAKEIPQDIRVIYKCAVPQCPAYGLSRFCPPHWQTPFEEAKQIVQSYKYAIVYKIRANAEDFTGPLGREYQRKWMAQVLTGGRLSEKPSSKGGGRARFVGSISRAVESEAYYDGYYFAMAFSVGSCRRSLCGQFGDCTAITTGVCRFPLLARPCGSP